MGIDDASDYLRATFGVREAPYTLKDIEGGSKLDPKYHHITPAVKDWQTNEALKERQRDEALNDVELAKRGVTFEIINGGINVFRKAGKSSTILTSYGRFVDHSEQFTVRGTDEKAQREARRLATLALTRYHIDHWDSVNETHRELGEFLEWCSTTLGLSLRDQNGYDNLQNRQVIDQYLEVDRDGLERDRRYLLDQQRKANGQAN